MKTHEEALKMALEALKDNQNIVADSHRHAYVMEYNDIIEKCEEALAQQSNEQVEPVAWQERQAKRISDGVVTEWTNWYPCRYRTIDEARAEACDHIPYEWRPLYTHPPVPTAQPKEPEQKQNLKLMPREATREMLEAMDECSMEGYDEHLYAGHAASVYMAAWDAFHGQHCYCGDITNLGVIHRDDGPCHYPEHKKPEQEPVVGTKTWFEDGKVVTQYLHPSDIYTTPPQRTWVGLTEEEKQTCIRQINELGKYSTHTVADDERLLIDVVESKLRSKNA